MQKFRTNPSRLCGLDLNFKMLKLLKIIPRDKLAIYSLYFIMFMDMFAVSLFIPSIKFRMKSIGVTDLWIGIVTSCYGLVQLVSTPVMGNFADIYNRKIVLILCLLLTSISYVVMGQTKNIILFVSMRLMTGWFKHTQVMGKAILSELSNANSVHLTSVLGSSEAFGTMGFAIGPLVGGFFVQNEDGFPYLCTAAAIIFAINIYLTVILLPDKLKQEEPLHENLIKSDINDNNIPPDANNEEVTAVNDDTNTNVQYKLEIVQIVVLNFMFCLAIHIIRESVPFMLHDKYNATLLQLGYMYSLQNLASTATGFAIGSYISKLYGNDKSRTMVVHGGILQLFSILLLLKTTSYAFTLIAMIIQSIANQFLGVGIKYVALLKNTKRNGTTLGFLQTASSSSRVFAPLIVGYFESNYDEIFILAGMGALLGLFGVLFLSNGYEKMKKS